MRRSDPKIGDDIWALQDAKAHLSELVERTLRTQRPQQITRRGAEAVVVLPTAVYRRLLESGQRSLVEFLRNPGPIPDEIIDRMNERQGDLSRNPRPFAP